MISLQIWGIQTHGNMITFIAFQLLSEVQVVYYIWKIPTVASPIAVTPFVLVIFGASLSGSTVGVCDNDKKNDMLKFSGILSITMIRQ